MMMMRNSGLFGKVCHAAVCDLGVVVFAFECAKNRLRPDSRTGRLQVCENSEFF